MIVARVVNDFNGDGRGAKGHVDDQLKLLALLLGDGEEQEVVEQEEVPLHLASRLVVPQHHRTFPINFVNPLSLLPNPSSSPHPLIYLYILYVEASSADKVLERR